jgi:ABC-type Zn uptake system ZnuABC Zn-binding protein ZnuA
MEKALDDVDSVTTRCYGFPTMKAFVFIFSGLLLLQGNAMAVNPEKPIKVVTTLTVLKDFVEQVGKERVDVTSLLSGLESQHTYTSSPSDILAIQRADMLVEVGLGLEIWTENLIANAHNPDLVIVTTSTGVPLLDEPPYHEPEEVPSRDVPHSVNPHIWLDPENAKIMIRPITAGLIELDPSQRSFYLNNQAAYFEKLDILQKNLVDRVNRLPNRKIITHHDAWPYFAQRFGFKIAGNIIIQVGTEPSVWKITHLIKTIKEENVKVIISEPQLNPQLPRILAEETGARVVLLTPIPGTLKGADTYYSMIKYNVENLIAALGE